MVASGRALSSADSRWVRILPKSRIRPGSQNIFRIRDRRPWTHLRLNIYPDGGVARLRAYGVGRPDLTRRRGRLLDLASILNGGCVARCNDMFFGPKDNLIMPGRAKDMGDGWETRRKRGPGHDWVIVRLGAAGRIEGIEIDTNHFKGNYPDRASLEGALAGTRGSGRNRWSVVLPPTKLKAHTRHFFAKALRARGPFDHVRLRIYPDGGVSRLRVWGRVR